MRLISVLMGAKNDSGRAHESQALLNYGFRFYKTYRLFSDKEVITSPRVWLGKRKHVDFGLQQPLYVTIPANQYKNLNATIKLNKKLNAPIVAGQSYGSLNVSLGKEVIDSVPLVAQQDDPKASIFSRSLDHIILFFKD